jgi:hypothetical protein
MSAITPEPLAVDSLLTSADLDEIDEAVADPIHDHAPQVAPKHKVNKVLGILDQLDRENSNRRCKS